MRTPCVSAFANESVHHARMKKWHGVPVLPRARKVLETELRKLAPAAHVVCFYGGFLKIGAASRICTGIA